MEDIMYEILTQGPVQAVMRVHTDLFMYGSGVYRVTDLARDRLAGHQAVKIVGWGVEGATRYWTVANTWGQDWGEGGYFRIVRGSNECGVEENVVGAWPSRRSKRRSQHRSKIHNRYRGVLSDQINFIREFVSFSARLNKAVNPSVANKNVSEILKICIRYTQRH